MTNQISKKCNSQGSNKTKTLNRSKNVETIDIETGNILQTTIYIYIYK